MLYTAETVRDNIRNRDVRRVFYMGSADRLTQAARDFLAREQIAILPASQARPQRFRLLSGGYLEEKPEHMTHLQSDLLVPKTHPRIAFRGKVDTLEAELLLCRLRLPRLEGPLEELLALARKLISSEVLEEPLKIGTLCGLSEEELRRHSHFPQEYYGQPHFMPSVRDSEAVLLLNRLRCAVRETELAAAAAFPEGGREDLQRALNRMSSTVYILMIREKAAMDG